MVYLRIELRLGEGKKKEIEPLFLPTSKGRELVNSIVEKMKEQGKFKTASNYLTAVRSWNRFIGKDDWLFSDINKDTVESYQRWLKERGVCPNTASAYMRALRALYHRACEHDSVETRTDVFTRVYTGRAKTTKRGVTQEVILQLHALQLNPNSSLALARDIFIFSFYAMGMPFVDIAYLKKEQVREGFIRYARHKTGQRIKVALLPAMRDIIHRYEQEDSEYVFPILSSTCPTSISDSTVSINERLHKLYRVRLRQYNYSLKRLSEKLGSSFHLSSYVVRHSWASIAYQHHLDIGMIGKALGHTKPSTTLIYIKSLEAPDLGAANHTLMEELGL